MACRSLGLVLLSWIGACFATGHAAMPAGWLNQTWPSYAPTAFVRNGTIIGTHSSTYNQDFFLGVPFAQPPVDDLRFRVPQSLNASFSEPYDASEYAPECVGYGGDDYGYPSSEDCLFLNVIRPSGYELQELPVGVWIHGGGLYMGGTRDERYNLTFIVENSVKIEKPIIAVSIAYRLSAWGFLQSQQVSGSGNTNIGLRDQRLALHWIQENIRGFGGDPQKVAIWGESAGAGSVGWHLTAYNGRDDGLFRGGIMESGNPVNYDSYEDNTFYQPLYDGIVRQANCQNATDTLECLRATPFTTLNNIFAQANYSQKWKPVVDGDFIQRFASIQLKEGAFVKVPIIDGANTDEGTSFSPRPVNSTDEFAEYILRDITEPGLPAHFLPEVFAAYPNNNPEYMIPPVEEIGNYSCGSTYGKDFRRSAAYAGDASMIANRRGTCETWAASGIPAYCYRFNTIPAGSGICSGVAHFTEVSFVFDNTQGLGYDAAHNSTNPFQDKPESYYALANLMSSSWASFIYDLNPNAFATRNPGTPAWPVYSTADPQNMVWDANATTLAYAEPDTFRQDGIRWILDHALAYRR